MRISGMWIDVKQQPPFLCTFDRCFFRFSTKNQPPNETKTSTHTLAHDPPLPLPLSLSLLAFVWYLLTRHGIGESAMCVFAWFVCASAIYYSLFDHMFFLHAFPTGSKYCRAELLMGFALSGVSCGLLASLHQHRYLRTLRPTLYGNASQFNGLHLILFLLSMLASRWRLDAGLSAHL